MSSFEEIGLRAELLRTLEEEEIEEPTALQEAVIPALRRGGNLVARASSGSGKTLAYTLGVLDRLASPEEDDERGLARLLILVPSAPEAQRVAIAVTPFAHAVGLSVAAMGGGWGTHPAGAVVLVAAAGDASDAVRSSTIKLDGVEAIIVDGASAIEELGDWDVVDELIDLVPRDAQRVVLTSSVTEAIDDLAERRVKKALRFPAEPAIPADRGGATAGVVSYVVSADREKLDLLAMQLRDHVEGAASPIVFCRSDERAADLAERLALRGFLVGGVQDGDADVVIAAGGATRDDMVGDVKEGAGQTISFDVPADPRTLLARHGGDPDAVVLVQPREVAHIREIAARAKLMTRSAPSPTDTSAAAAMLKTFRDEVRTALREEDLTAQMLILEPLLDEHSAAEVAAALAALLRARRSAPSAAVTPGAPETRAPAAPKAALEKSAPAGPAPATWARLFVSIGSRDDIRPGDLVGALAGEANIQGSRIGKIEIRDSFSIVEVQADVADQVIRAVNGTTIKGRSARVDYDRGGPSKRPGHRNDSPRRSSRRPPAS